MAAGAGCGNVGREGDFRKIGDFHFTNTDTVIVQPNQVIRNVEHHYHFYMNGHPGHPGGSGGGDDGRGGKGFPQYHPQFPPGFSGPPSLPPYPPAATSVGISDCPSKPDKGKGQGTKRKRAGDTNDDQHHHHDHHDTSHDTRVSQHSDDEDSDYDSIVGPYDSSAEEDPLPISKSKTFRTFMQMKHKYKTGHW